MPTSKGSGSEEEKRGPITLDELIRGELKGKNVAMARYDSILWKVRSGYIVVLYGVLTMLGGGDKIPWSTIGISVLSVLPLVVWGISLSAFLVDTSFILSKLRVVEARDKLSDLALKLATMKPRTNSEDSSAAESAVADAARELLHISGEAPRQVARRVLLNATWSTLVLYLANPLAITCLFLFAYRR